MENKPAHGQRGDHREFIGKWDVNIQYSGDREGCDIYCGNCDTWNTVEGTNILYSVVGKCKKCGHPFREPVIPPTITIT